MKKGIIIFGPAGSGKTTLGKMVAQQLGFMFVDIDNYIWRKDTEIPFSLMYSRAERISNLMGAISQINHFVIGYRIFHTPQANGLGGMVREGLEFKTHPVGTWIVIVCVHSNPTQFLLQANLLRTEKYSMVIC